MTTITTQATVNNWLLIPKKHLDNLNWQDIVIKIYLSDKTKSKVKSNNFLKFLWLWKKYIPNISDNELVNYSLKSKFKI
jgi:hypothetical protein